MKANARKSASPGRRSKPQRSRLSAKPAVDKLPKPSVVSQRPQLVLFVATAVLMIGAVWASLVADRAGLLTLSFLTPAIDGLRRLGSFLQSYAHATQWVEFGALGVLSLGAALYLRNRDREGSHLFFATALLPLAYYWVRTDHLALGTLTAVVALSVVARFLPPARSEKRSPGDSTPALSVFEIRFLAAVLLVVIAYRFYGLNLISFENDWGEETPHHVVSSFDFPSAVTLGLQSPYISQGFLWYVVHHVGLKLFGVRLLSTRLVLAAISVAVVPVYYFLCRRLAGKPVAVIATAFLAFGPYEIAGARNDYFFTLVTLVHLGLLLASERAYRNRSHRNLITMSLLTATTNLLYAAGTIGLFFPYVRFASLLRRKATEYRTWIYLAFGFALWLYLPTLINFAVNGNSHFLSYYQSHASQAIFRPDTIPVNDNPNPGIWVKARFLTEILFNNLTEALKAFWVRSYEGATFRISSAEPKAVFPVAIAVFFFVGLISLLRNRLAGNRLLIAGWGLLTCLPGLAAANFQFHRFLATLPCFFLIGAIGLWECLEIFRAGWGRKRFDEWARPIGWTLLGGLAVFNGAYYFSQTKAFRTRAFLKADRIRPYVAEGTTIIASDGRLNELLFAMYEDVARLGTRTLFLEGTPQNHWGREILAGTEPPGRDQWLYRFSPLRYVDWTSQIQAVNQRVTYVVTAERQFAKEELSWLRTQNVVSWDEVEICPNDPDCHLTIVRTTRSANP